MDYFFDKILLPLIVGILGSFLYPLIRAYVRNPASSYRDWRIKAILRDYHLIRSFTEDYSLLIATMLVYLGFALGYLVLIVSMVGVMVLLEIRRDVFTIVLFSYFGASSLRLLWLLIRYYLKTFAFPKYRTEIKKKLGKLRFIVNPDDIKPETEEQGG